MTEAELLGLFGAKTKARQAPFADADRLWAEYKATLEGLESRRVALRDELIAEFDGAIKYEPFTKDILAGCWAKERVGRELKDWMLEKAREWHAKAVEQLRKAEPPDYARWNQRVPYCRNIPTAALLKEAGH